MASAQIIKEKLHMKFLDKIRRFSLKKAGYISLAVATFMIILHILIIAGIFPYSWVNGGRSESFDAARSTSFSSIIVILFGVVLKLFAARIVPVKLNRFFGVLITILLIISLPFEFIGIVQQLLGTFFEKCVCSIFAAAAFLADFRIAVEKR